MTLPEALNLAVSRPHQADALKVHLALEDAEQDLLVLRENQAVAARDLGRSVGLDACVEPSMDGQPSLPRLT